MKDKIHKLKIRAIDRGIFEDIKNGLKKIETRAAIAGYCKIKKGDKIVFVCGQEKIEKKIEEAALYKNIGDLFKHYGVKDIFPRLTTVGEATKNIIVFLTIAKKLRSLA